MPGAFAYGMTPTTSPQGIKLFHTSDDNSPERAVYGSGWEGYSFYFEKPD